jgi:hypothetical protein
MAALIRMTERCLTREELADLAGMTPACVLEVGLHSPSERARLAVALGWPPGYFDDSSTIGPAAPLPSGKPLLQLGMRATFRAGSRNRQQTILCIDSIR